MNRLFIIEESISFGRKWLFISAKSKEDAVSIALKENAFVELKSNSGGIVRVLEQLGDIHEITIPDIEKGGLLHLFEFSE
jgi:hypothetical protein